MKKASSAVVLEQWMERDLTATALKGALSPAFEIEDQLNLASEVLLSGRNLIIVGESGVGKTGLIGELVRRAVNTDASALSGRRVVQLSFRHRVASLKTPNLLVPETQRLVEALCEASGEVIPVLRGNLEPFLEAWRAQAQQSPR